MSVITINLRSSLILLRFCFSLLQKIRNRFIMRRIKEFLSTICLLQTRKKDKNYDKLEQLNFIKHSNNTVYER